MSCWHTRQKVRALSQAKVFISVDNCNLSWKYHLLDHQTDDILRPSKAD